jgi:hypothetical protein
MRSQVRSMMMLVVSLGHPAPALDATAHSSRGADSNEAPRLPREQNVPTRQGALFPSAAVVPELQARIRQLLDAGG